MPIFRQAAVANDGGPRVRSRRLRIALNDGSDHAGYGSIHPTAVQAFAADGRSSDPGARGLRRRASVAAAGHPARRRTPRCWCSPVCWRATTPRARCAASSRTTVTARMAGARAAIFGPRDGVEGLLLDRIKELNDRYGRKVGLSRSEPRRALCAAGGKARARGGAAGDHARQPLHRQSARHQRVAGVRVRQRPPRRRGACRRSAERSAAGPDDGDLFRAPTASAPGNAAWSGTGRRPRASRSTAATAASATIRRRSMPSRYRLAQPEGAWKPFDRGGWRSLIYPDHRRAH